MVIIDPQTVGKVADAATALAKTGGKAIDAAGGSGRIVKGPIEELVGIVRDRVKFDLALRMRIS
jgi:hypothetical protein